MQFHHFIVNDFIFKIVRNFHIYQKYKLALLIFCLGVGWWGGEEYEWFVLLVYFVFVQWAFILLYHYFFLKNNIHKTTNYNSIVAFV